MLQPGMDNNGVCSWMVQIDQESTSAFSCEKQTHSQVILWMIQEYRLRCLCWHTHPKNWRLLHLKIRKPTGILEKSTPKPIRWFLGVYPSFARPICFLKWRGASFWFLLWLSQKGPFTAHGAAGLYNAALNDLEIRGNFASNSGSSFTQKNE